MSTPEENIKILPYFRKRGILIRIRSCKIAGLYRPPFYHMFQHAGMKGRAVLERRIPLGNIRLEKMPSGIFDFWIIPEYSVRSPEM